MLTAEFLRQALAVLILTGIFTFGTYAVAYFLKPIKWLFWTYIAIVFVGAVLPPFIAWQFVNLAVIVGGGTALGAYLGLRSKDEYPWGQWDNGD